MRARGGQVEEEEGSQKSGEALEGSIAALQQPQEGQMKEGREEKRLGDG